MLFQTLRGGKKDTQKEMRKEKQLIENQLCTVRKKKKRKDQDVRGLLDRQLPYVHDQPLAVLFMIDWLHLHHRGFDP